MAIETALMGVPIGLVAIYFGFQHWNKYVKVRDIPTSKARSMAAGLVELNGKVNAIKELLSPISKCKCVYFKVEHQRYIRTKNGGSWITYRVEEEFQNFYLKDETGKIEIDPRKAEIDIPQDKMHYYGLGMRKIERFLAVNDDIYILGTAKIKPGVKSAVNEENFIMTKGESELFYYITDKKEKDVQKSLKLKALAVISIGLVISIGALILYGACAFQNYCL